MLSKAATYHQFSEKSAGIPTKDTEGKKQIFVSKIMQEIPETYRCREMRTLEMDGNKKDGLSKSETSSLEKKIEVPKASRIEEGDKKEVVLIESAELMKNINEKTNQHESILEEHNSRILNVMEDMKKLENRHKALINDRQTALVKTMGKTTIAWSKKFQKLDGKVDDFAISCKTIRKEENQKISKKFKAVKETLQRTLTNHTINFRQKLESLQKELELEMEKLSKSQNTMMSEINVAKSEIQKLHTANLSTQDQIKSGKDHFINLQKELEKWQKEAELECKSSFGKALENMEEKTKSLEYEMKRREQQWDMEKGFWEAHTKHSGDLLESLKECVQQNNESTLTKERKYATLEMHKLQCQLEEREKEMNLIEKQFSAVISRINRPMHSKYAT
ncbi:nuclear matrix constituent protein 1a-like isoform X2 [Ischnura elegans]|uniref:nuclear matrix constituent protein 1a-like isoform X2 n=1 Tax=Ischnura elegans TaxID=197161 RepID=UPI001ED8B9F0|nr:nuclear matrix constituent protein 1a-like isoform X2 [Ischnura elegans]